MSSLKRHVKKTKLTTYYKIVANFIEENGQQLKN